jgi:hypothetical protein
MHNVMPMARRVKLCSIALSVVLRLTSSLSAQDKPLELDWEAPAHCPDRSWVLRSVQARLADTAAHSPPRAAVRARGRITQRDAGYVLDLRTDQGERQLRAASCEQLANSAALILAFAAEPEQDTALRAAPTSAGDVPSPDLNLGGYLRAEWVVDVGMLPQAATGPGIALGLVLSATPGYPTSIELSAGFLLKNTVSYLRSGSAAHSSELAQLHAFAAQLALCQQIADVAQLSVCMLGEHMRLTADPSDVIGRASTQSAPVWTLLLAARLAVPIGTRFAWMVELGAGVPLLGARFGVEGIGTIHETSDVVGRLRTGLSLRF